MSNWEFVTYGGYDSISQALTMMQLIFHNNQYQGLWYGVALFGIMLAGFKHFSSALMAGKGGGLSWLAPPLIGIALMFSFIRTEANLQLIDYSTSQTGGYTVPLGLAMSMGMLNKIEVGMVEIISGSGAVDQPSNYRKFAGGSGYNLFEKISKNRNVNMEKTASNYITDCVIPVAAFNNYANFDPRAWLYGDTVAGIGFFDMLATGQATLLTTFDLSSGIETERSCATVYITTLQPFYSNPVNFISDANALCKENGYDPSNASALAECHSKMAIILDKLTNKTMTTETYLQMQSLSQIASANLNNADPSKVAELQASKTLQTQGAGIGAVFTKFAPIVKNIMWSLVIGLFPLCALFIATPLYGKIFGFLFGLMVLLTSWTIIDCSLHTAYTYYVSNLFGNLATMGQGTMFYAQMPNVASDTLAFYGILKGSSLMLATAFGGIFGLSGSHAMTQFAGGIQSTLDNAGRSAGAVAFTPEGRAGAIREQQQVGETMANAHSFKPDQMWEKGRINSQNSYGQAMGIKTTHEEAMKNGIVPQGSDINQSVAEMAKRGGMNQIGGFKSQEDGMKAAKAQNIFPQNGDQTEYARASGNSKHSLVGTDGKSYSMAVDQSGKAVWSKSEVGHSGNTASDDMNNATKTFATTNLGAMSGNIENGFQKSLNTTLGKASKNSENVAKTSSDNVTAITGNDANLVADVSKSEQFAGGRSKTISDQYTAKFGRTQSAGKHFAKGTTLSEDEGVSFAQNVSAEISADASLGGGIKTPIAEIQAKVAARMIKSGQIQHVEGLKKALSNSKSTDWNDVKTDAEDWSHTVAGIKSLSSTDTQSATYKGADSQMASYKKQVQLGESFTKAVSTEDSVNKTVSAMKTEGGKSNFNINGLVYDQMVADNGGGEKGKAIADKIVLDSNRTGASPGETLNAKGKMEDASTKVFDKIGADILSRASATETTANTTIATNDALVTKGRDAQANPETFYDAGKKDIDAKRTAQHVEAGHKIQTVSEKVTPAEQKTQRDKIPAVVNREQGFNDNFKASDTKLDRLEHPIPLTEGVAALATILSPTAGMAVQEGSGMAREAVMDGVKSSAQIVKDEMTKDIRKMFGR